MTDMVTRFWSKVDKKAPNDCWEWTAYTEKGYGRCAWTGNTGQTWAHRFSYESTYGKIPKGKMVLHSCDNPPCVNPKHLRVGTQKDNMRDMSIRGRNTSSRNRGSSNGGSKLTESNARGIIQGRRLGLSLKDLSMLYGVAESQVSEISNGNRWKHVSALGMVPTVMNKRNRSKGCDPVYVGRPSRFGNPFEIGKHGTRAEVIEKYRRVLLSQPELVRDVKKTLRGRDLECWCAPLPCHADVLLEVANG